uniref:hypothetical protein n=1 Tax=Parerythrobacter lutipelagi TaxID=1964208 RepID=UPI0010F5066E|nr:hypothetical protein [Parerythrobacter lutipelagi]
MKNAKNVWLAATAAIGLASCSEQTQNNAQLAAERAGDDIEANADVVGEVIEEGAIDAADAVSKGAANLRDNLEAGDTEEPGPAPLMGDDLSQGGPATAD